ncbi:MAG: hypothetical protein ACLR60_18740 [Clostridium paraputrificum]
MKKELAVQLKYNRPQFQELKGKLRKDDILIITDKMIRRNADDVIEFKRLKANGIRVIA